MLWIVAILTIYARPFLLTPVTSYLEVEHIYIILGIVFCVRPEDVIVVSTGWAFDVFLYGYMPVLTPFHGNWWISLFIFAEATTCGPQSPSRPEPSTTARRLPSHSKSPSGKERSKWTCWVRHLWRIRFRWANGCSSSKWQLLSQLVEATTRLRSPHLQMMWSHPRAITCCSRSRMAFLGHRYGRKSNKQIKIPCPLLITRHTTN